MVVGGSGAEDPELLAAAVREHAAQSAYLEAGPLLEQAAGYAEHRGWQQQQQHPQHPHPQQYHHQMPGPGRYPGQQDPGAGQYSAPYPQDPQHPPGAGPGPDWHYDQHHPAGPGPSQGPAGPGYGGGRRGASWGPRRGGGYGWITPGQQDSAPGGGGGGGGAWAGGRGRGRGSPEDGASGGSDFKRRRLDEAGGPGGGGEQRLLPPPPGGEPAAGGYSAAAQQRRSRWEAAPGAGGGAAATAAAAATAVASALASKMAAGPRHAHSGALLSSVEELYACGAALSGPLPLPPQQQQQPGGRWAPDVPDQLMSPLVEGRMSPLREAWEGAAQQPSSSPASPLGQLPGSRGDALGAEDWLAARGDASVARGGATPGVSMRRLAAHELAAQYKQRRSQLQQQQQQQQAGKQPPRPGTRGPDLGLDLPPVTSLYEEGLTLPLVRGLGHGAASPPRGNGLPPVSSLHDDGRNGSLRPPGSSLHEDGRNGSLLPPVSSLHDDGRNGSLLPPVSSLHDDGRNGSLLPPVSSLHQPPPASASAPVTANGQHAPVQQQQQQQPPPDGMDADFGDGGAAGGQLPLDFPDAWDEPDANFESFVGETVR